jgi:hypothetical protein
VPGWSHEPTPVSDRLAEFASSITLGAATSLKTPHPKENKDVDRMTLESGEVLTKSVRTARYVIEGIGVSSLMISTPAPRVRKSHIIRDWPASNAAAQ